MSDKILYHGSTQLVEYPEIRIARFNKDFYFGFYCTLFANQAKRWTVRFDGSGIMNEYIYTPDESMKILKFSDMTEEWLDFIVSCRLGNPHEYDNVADCKYEVPDYWTIGKVYEQLIEDISADNVVDNIISIYNSWISQAISNYNSDFFYQSRDYIAACYKEGIGIIKVFSTKLPETV